ncbi:MAG TPA: tetratricopeptide repeat protein [Candidatus Elarobacter sp.]|jgi:predicted ATPase/class 3 adenylate cyclase|nr:tetratricopeptide repeat protein [Candidatus Elarobacter sp.]
MRDGAASSASGFPTGIVTFLFTDIEGSTRLWEGNPAAMGVALAAHDEILRNAIEERHGVVFKTVGDAFCAAFDRPIDALGAAVDAQLRIAAHGWAESIGALRVRMGIHTGSALETGGDYFGPTVNRVARFMSIGFGEQILVSGASAELLRDVLPEEMTLSDLGTHRLKDLDRPEPAYQVIAPGLRAAFPPLKSLDARPNNLPFEISSFVGRERELAELHESVERGRLVTIVGPGGIGKTRLAHRLAAEAIGGFSGGAFVVQLSPLRDAELIAQSTADALSLREEPHAPLADTLVRALAGVHMLIVFDGAEHLIPETAGFVKLLLTRCSAVTVVVTSREPLHVTGEKVVRIGALQDAADLFLARAREVSPRIAADSATVAEICSRLDGIPLAIELAAARVSTHSVAELEARLSKRLPLLVSRDPTVEERHRTLRGTIAWSDGLLGADEAAVFHSLGVFDGTFGVAAIAAVTERDDAELVDSIDALVEKSLVSGSAEGAPRYALLGTLREYVVERAAQNGTLEVLRARHFAWFAGLVSTLAERAATGDAAGAFDEIALEISNVRAALDWGLRARPEDAAAVVATLARYWKVRGHVAEGRAWFRRVLARPEISDPVRAALLRRAATFATEQDDYDEARSLDEQARSLYERLGDHGGLGEALHTLAVIEQRHGDPDAAAGHYASAIAEFRTAGHDYGVAMASLNLALLAFGCGDLDEAARRIDEAADAAGRVRNEDLNGNIAAFRGILAVRRGDLDEAARFSRQALEVKRKLGNRLDVAEICDDLALIDCRRGRIGDARAAAAEGLRIALDLNAAAPIVNGFEAFCEIALYERRYEDAALCWGFARAVRAVHAYRPAGTRDMAEVERSLRGVLADSFDAIADRSAGADWRAAARALSDVPTG